MTSMYFIFALTICIRNVVALNPIVKTGVGMIRGLNADDGDYSMFLGIPYAEVQNENPFGVSTSYPVFNETYNAFDDSIVCPCFETYNYTIIGSLDCLRLNVYVPNTLSSNETLPVLIFLYSGAFAKGLSQRTIIGPKFFMKQNVILITLNYRVGPYGFMCLNDPKVPGNQGLKDQVLALKWIKSNIDAFGGDVNKITLSGQSAGSVSTDIHMLFDTEKYFDQAIMQSGTSLSTWAFEDPDYDSLLKIAEYLGFETNNIDEAITKLATVDVKTLINATQELKINFVPCVEKVFDGVENYITTDPMNVEKTTYTTPILIGTTEDELIYVYAKMNSSNLIDKFYDKLNMEFNFTEDYLYEMERITRHFYIGDDETTDENRKGIIDFDSDFLYQHPTERSIDKYIDGANIYRYVFSYLGGRNADRTRFNVTFGGASHGDENGYLYEAYNLKSPNADDQVMINRMTTMWANFVKYGDPTPEVTDLLPVKWLPVTRERMNYMSIDSELSMKARPFQQRMAYWDLFYILNEKLQRGYVENKCGK